MAKRLEAFCQCSYCNTFFPAKSEMFRWFNQNFCSLVCLSIFHRVNVIECAECERELSEKKGFFPKKIGKRMVYFCSGECLEQYKGKKCLCAFCSRRLLSETKLSLNSATKFFCSTGCSKKWSLCNPTESNRVTVCSLCRESAENYKGISINGAPLDLCEEKCFSALSRVTHTEYVVCTQCGDYFPETPYLMSVIHAKEGDKVFCNNICQDYYMANNDKMADCAACGTTGRYYHMIRNSFESDDKAWCSLACASAGAENGGQIADLVQHKTSDSVDTTNNNDHPNEINTVFLLNNNSSSAHGTESRSTKTGENSLTQHKIRPLTDEEKETMFLERGECMEPKCSDCNAKISDTKPFLRFEAMDFCGKACLQHFFMANAKKCFSCEANTTAVSSHVFSARIGSELRYFCTSACQTSYLAMLEVCTFCDSAIKDADFVHDDAMKKYCSTDCMDKYAVFIVKNKKLAKERCIDCNELKTVKVNFDYNGTIYPFCSLKCFFAVRLVCGIQAETCVICQKYAVVRTGNVSIVRVDRMPYIVCSKICMNHFMRKYAKMVDCDFCHNTKNKLNMIIVLKNNGDSYFCSTSCIELSEEVAEAAKQRIEPVSDESLRESEGYNAEHDKENMKPYPRPPKVQKLSVDVTTSKIVDVLKGPKATKTKNSSH